MWRQFNFCEGRIDHSFLFPDNHNSWPSCDCFLRIIRRPIWVKEHSPSACCREHSFLWMHSYQHVGVFLTLLCLHSAFGFFMFRTLRWFAECSFSSSPTWALHLDRRAESHVSLDQFWNWWWSNDKWDCQSIITIHYIIYYSHTQVREIVLSWHLSRTLRTALRHLSEAKCSVLSSPPYTPRG